MYSIVENHFKAIQKIKAHTKNDKPLKFLPSIVQRYMENNLIKKLAQDPIVFKQKFGNKISFKMAVKTIMIMLRLQKQVMTRKYRMQIRSSNKYIEQMAAYEEKSKSLAPKIEGRIIKIESEEVKYRF